MKNTKPTKESINEAINKAELRRIYSIKGISKYTMIPEFEITSYLIEENYTIK